MTYTDDHYYLTFGGGIGGLEQWQTGVRFWPLPSNPIANADFLLSQLNSISTSDCLALVTTFIKGTFPVFQEGVTVSWLKLAVIKEDGDYAGDAKMSEQAPQGGVGGTSSPWPQLALCVSLWSGSGFGRANHGRMYLPCPAQISPDPITGKITPQAHVDGTRTKMLKLLADLNGEVTTLAVQTVPAIMSNIGTGTTKTVARVGVGGVLDTIRARRNHLDDTVATWSNATWPTSSRAGELRSEWVDSPAPAPEEPAT